MQYAHSNIARLPGKLDPHHPAIAMASHNPLTAKLAAEAADEARHQSSRSTKGTETAKRWRQWAEYAAATARDEIRLRSSEFSPAARVQLYEPWSVTPPSMTIV